MTVIRRNASLRITGFFDGSGVNPNIGVNWRGENTHHVALNFYPIFIPLFEAKDTRCQGSAQPLA